MKLVMQLWDGKGDQVIGQDAVHLPDDLPGVLASGARAAWPASAPGWIGHLAPPAGADLSRCHIRWRAEPCPCLSCQSTAAPPQVRGATRSRRRHGII